MRKTRSHLKNPDRGIRGLAGTDARREEDECRGQSTNEQRSRRAGLARRPTDGVFEMASCQPTWCRALSAALPVALVLTFALGVSRAEAAPGAKLKGKWKAVAMEVGGKRHPVKAPMSIIFHFKGGKKLTVTISNGKRTMVQNGTWSATATVLTMKIKGETEVARYKVTATKLTMDKSVAGRKAKYHLKKIP